MSRAAQHSNEQLHFTPLRLIRTNGVKQVGGTVVCCEWRRIHGFDPAGSLKRFDNRPVSLSVSVDIIPLEISQESHQSQSKHDALHCHPGNPFSWLRPAPPEAAGCFHLSSRGRLCCRRRVNITLFHSWGCSFAYTPVVTSSHLCSAASL